MISGRPLLACLALGAALAGCRAEPARQDTSAAASTPDTPLAAPPAASGNHAATAAAEPAPQGPQTPPGPPPAAPPAAVLSAWGKAVEARDWPRVRALWGRHGADSGLSPQAFAARWSHLRAPRVTIGSGQIEGAAGSSFYTAPVRIDDGARTIGGELTLRRANDVPGATAEQLRWHLDAATRAPWTTLR